MTLLIAQIQSLWINRSFRISWHPVIPSVEEHNMRRVKKVKRMENIKEVKKIEEVVE